MAFFDELRAALMAWGPNRPVILPPLPPEPGMPAGNPALAAGITPLAADGAPLLDSGLHLYQPRDIGSLLWTARYRRFLALQSGQGLQDYPGALIPAVLLNRFNEEDFYPEETIFWGGDSSVQNAGQTSVVIFFNPATSRVQVTVEEIAVTRINTAGLVRISNILSSAALGAQQYAVRDTRLPTSVTSTPMVFAHDNTGAAPSGAQSGPVVGCAAGGPSTILRSPVVLAPGTGFEVFPSIVNEGVALSVAWRQKLIPT